jgi:RecB family exonuclease
MSIIITASRLQRAVCCPASVVLPQVQEESEPARRGTAIHAFLAAVPDVGRDAALAEVPADYRADCEVIDLETLPIADLDEIAAEVAFAFDVETGEARELGRNIGRAYQVGPTEIAGTADVVAFGPFELYVADFKTGRGIVASPRANWQLKLLALAASRTYGVDQVRVAIIRLREDGTPEYESAVFTAFDLDLAAAELRDLVQSINRLQTAVANGLVPDVNTGAHCRRCAAAPACPAFKGLVQRLAGEPDAVADQITAELTPETAARAWARLKQVEEIIRRAREGLYAFARETPIQLGDGRVLGETATRRRVLDGRVAYDCLEKLHGLAVAEAAVDVEASQASIERALREVARESGATLAGLKRGVMAEMEKAGGIEVHVSRSVREHVVPAEEAAEVLPAAEAVDEAA